MQKSVFLGKGSLQILQGLWQVFEIFFLFVSVKSFGTEDRPAAIQVQSSDEQFEYIIFKGTDIKKIEVCEAPKPQHVQTISDPAIVQVCNLTLFDYGV